MAGCPRVHRFFGADRLFILPCEAGEGDPVGVEGAASHSRFSVSPHRHGAYSHRATSPAAQGRMKGVYGLPTRTGSGVLHTPILPGE